MNNELIEFVSYEKILINTIDELSKNIPILIKRENNFYHPLGASDINTCHMAPLRSISCRPVYADFYYEKIDSSQPDIALKYLLNEIEGVKAICIE